MEDYLFYLLELYYKAGKQGINTRHIMDFVYHSHEYLELLNQRNPNKPTEGLGYFKSHGYTNPVFKDSPLDADQISEKGERAYLYEKQKRVEITRKEKRDDEFKDLTTQVSKSVIDANSFQKRNGNRTLAAIWASALFALATVVSSIILSDKQTSKTLQKQEKSLDSLKQSLQRIDTTLLKFLKNEK